MKTKYRIVTNKVMAHHVVGFNPENIRKDSQGKISFTVYVDGMDQDYFEKQLSDDVRVMDYRAIK